MVATPMAAAAVWMHLQFWLPSSPSQHKSRCQRSSRAALGPSFKNAILQRISPVVKTVCLQRRRTRWLISIPRYSQQGYPALDHSSESSEKDGVESRPHPLAGTLASLPARMNRFPTKRFGWVSHAVNVAIVITSLFGAIWSWLTVSADFRNAWQELLHSASFLRFRTAWMALPAQNWAALERCLHSRPWKSASVMTGAAYALADWTAQRCEGRGPFGFNRVRLFRNTLVGAGILAPYAHLYYELQDRFIPSKSLLFAPLKVLLDQSIYAVSYNCLYLSGLGFLQSQSPKQVIQTIKDKLPFMMLGSWRFWPFIHCFTYTVIPTQFKLLWVDAVDVIWVAYLSMVANSRRAETTQVVKQVVKQQTSGQFLEWLRARKALSTLAERCSQLNMTGPGFSAETEPVMVTDDVSRNLTVVQIAEADRPGLLLDVMLSLRWQRVEVVHGIIDSTDSRLAANIFYVRDFHTNGPLSRERREELQNFLQNRLRMTSPRYLQEVSSAWRKMEVTEDPLQEEVSEKAPDSHVSAPPHAATELLYSIEVDKKTRLEVGRALEGQGLEVPDTWWDPLKAVRASATESEMVAIEEDIKSQRSSIEEGVPEHTGSMPLESAKNSKSSSKDGDAALQIMKPTTSLVPIKADDSKKSILSMEVNVTDVSTSLANIIQGAVETDPTEESLPRVGSREDDAALASSAPTSNDNESQESA
eukprot:gnl/MRDRNA2_/MRDRNA2_79765_c0_seq2.p1 gnl/MRDRNA2_/MRDRNA2_79765_c0~~gnl/MRDRNA2_/MRDRNA2_79765_c0_seq2.p1  ORF type:complete len:702 (-),score=117.53 gnl/MRDRNA2_/MRDRNA2_79765_c0_seq2:340-2445(-)